MYAAGYAKYEAMEYRAALDHFLASILHNPFDARFQLSAGACLAELGDYERALAHYSVAGTLDPDNIEAMIFASECLIRAGNDEAAKAGLSMVLAQTGEGEADSRARSRASELLRAHYPEVRQAR
jgi:tetratricopeptide (TPR) repeat protein